MNGNGKFSTTSVEPVHLTGKTIAHSCSWSETKRAKLAAKATFGAVVISPLTAIQAAELFNVPKSMVAEELKRLGHRLCRSRNSNGHATATPARWDSLTSEQKSEFLKANFDAIWNELDLRTS